MRNVNVLVGLGVWLLWIALAFLIVWLASQAVIYFAAGFVSILFGGMALIALMWWLALGRWIGRQARGK